MKKNDILKAFVKESGSMLLVVKKNNFKYYQSILWVVISGLISLSLLRVVDEWTKTYDAVFYIGWFLIFLPIILYFEYYKSQKEQFLILHQSESIDIEHRLKFCFWLKKANRTQVKILLISDLDIISVSSKGEDEIILLSNGELPWGNRKIVLSDEFKDRKEEVVEFLKLIFLNK
jgi:hypothetical protein